MKIDKDCCTACGECASVCPTGAISPAKGVYKIDPDGCTECEG
jgi:ferredoxin